MRHDDGPEYRDRNGMIALVGKEAALGKKNDAVWQRLNVQNECNDQMLRKGGNMNNS